MMPEKTHFSIVVLGGMNPRIHHPYFYEAIGLLKGEAFEQALVSDATVCTPQVSQLNLAGLQIVCLPERWQVGPAQASDVTVQQLAHVANTVMAALEHTPTNAIAFNFDFELRTNLADVGAYFGGLAAKLPLGLCPSSSATSSLMYLDKSVEDDAIRRVTLNLAGSQAHPSVLSFRVNCHYDITTPGYFSFPEFTTSRINRDFESAMRQLALTVDELGKVL